jgi:hypothetical protein
MIRWGPGADLDVEGCRTKGDQSSSRRQKYGTNRQRLSKRQKFDQAGADAVTDRIELLLKLRDARDPVLGVADDFGEQKGPRRQRHLGATRLGDGTVLDLYALALRPRLGQGQPLGHLNSFQWLATERRPIEIAGNVASGHQTTYGL